MQDDRCPNTRQPVNQTKSMPCIDVCHKPPHRSCMISTHCEPCMLQPVPPSMPEKTNDDCSPHLKTPPTLLQPCNPNSSHTTKHSQKHITTCIQIVHGGMVHRLPHLEPNNISCCT